VVNYTVHLRVRVLGSGSSGNATLVEARGTRILLDAGLGPRLLAERLADAGVDPEHLDAIFLSHEHGDHARGAAAFSRKWGVRLVGTRGTYAALGLGAEEIAGYDVFEPGTQRRVGALTVTAVRVPHDAVSPLAFVVTCDGSSFGHATDLGHVGRGLVQSFAACDAVLMESNYDPGMLRDGPYPWSLKERILGPHGHLANRDAGRYLADGLPLSCRTVILAHLSETNNHPELALMSAETALKRRRRTGVRLVLTGRHGTEWIDVGRARRAPREDPSQLRLF
jgi:phosphoribosyl 1,2-cyclic phosphodiesterase